MIPPNQVSNLFQDSSLNMTPMETFYIYGYKGEHEFLQDVPNRAWTLISMVKVLHPKDETVTRGSLYKFAMLNSSEINDLGKTLKSPNW